MNEDSIIISETSIHWRFVEPFLKPADFIANKLDVGSGGRSCLPHPRVSLDRLTSHPGVNYCLDVRPTKPFPFEKSSFGWVHSSHFLEDFDNWREIVKNMVRVLTHPGGLLTILVPDHVRFRQNVANGAPDNLDHRHEFELGELSDFVQRWTFNQNFQTVHEALVGDYSILYIGRKVGYIE